MIDGQQAASARGASGARRCRQAKAELFQEPTALRWKKTAAPKWQWAASALVCVLSGHATAQGTPAPDQVRQVLQASPVNREIKLAENERAALGVGMARALPGGVRRIVASGIVSSLPGHEWVVTAPLAGTITRKLADLGDPVAAGQALAQLSSPALGELRRQIEEASTERKQAELALERDRALLVEGMIAPMRLQASEARYAVALAAQRAREAERQAAGLQSNDASPGEFAVGRITAPMRGQIVEATVTAGQRVEIGSNLFRIADPSMLQIEIDLSIEKAAQVRPGDRFVVQGERGRGTIIGISRALHPGQQARARARLERGGRLALGELVNVEIETRDAALPAASGKAEGAKASPPPRSVWLLPSQALSQLRDQSIVFVATPQGFRAEPVEVLGRSDGQIQVLASILASDRIAISGVAALRALLQKAD